MKQVKPCPKCGTEGCLDCDFYGTLEGYEQMRRMDKEAYEVAVRTNRVTNCIEQ